ncbi:hypothetical protein [Rhizobium sp. RU36D]|uniref:hypothetical protein n=1 Tax=Rhizobium sp. RU36D TaxID=1907415 RepID=UPI0009D7AC12|nr:hypothetical protein [Rhizobium sp. RU36D]SMD20333.1 hypothetical protein SAMN05880593_1534 [Rhizobium sp. RU36D]
MTVRRIAAVWAAAVFGAGVLYSRTSGHLHNAQFWAEDGAVFFKDAFITDGTTIALPFAGYLHFMPRFTAEAASLFPSASAPAIYVWAAFAVSVWAVLVVAASRLPGAPFLAAVMLMVPHTGEVLATITNVQWICAAALTAVACSPSPSGRLNRANQVVFTFAASLSGPFSVFIGPVAVARAWRFRDPFSILIASIICGAAALQFYMVLHHYAAFEGEKHALHLALTLIDRVFGTLTHGWRSETPGELMLVAAVIAILFLLLSIKEIRWYWWCFAFVFAASLASTWTKFAPGMSMHFDWPSMDDRYFFVPRLLVVWSFAMALVVASMFWRAISALCLGVCLLAGLYTHDHDWWNKRPLEPMSWRAEAMRLDQGQSVSIPINPPPYTVTIQR